MDKLTSLSNPDSCESSSFLSRLFLCRLPEERRAQFAGDARLESVLQGLLRDAQTSQMQIATDDFLSLIVASLSAQVNDCAALSMLRTKDLLLVYGFNHEDPISTEVIERRYLPQVEQSLRSYALDALDLAEIIQTLRQRLWSSKTPQPGMAQYSGRGDLLEWLRITAIREAGHLTQRKQKTLELPDDDCIEAGQLATSPELHFLKEQYREGFRRAFDEAMATLSSKDRNLLRYSYLDNLSIDEIGDIYKVHRATVARWLNQVREQLRKQTGKNLMRQSALAGVDVEEILQVIWSQLNVSIRGHLALKVE